MSNRDLDLQGAVAKDDSVHLASVADYLERQGVSCALRGAVRTRDGLVHHHDAGCLVQAGRESLRPVLDQVEAEVDTVLERNTSLWAQLDEVQATLEIWRTRIRDISNQNLRMVEFMAETPAVGPYETILDMWVEFEAEHGSDDPHG